MAWRDNLRPASFRGVPFNIDNGSVGIGRRLARHEYPQRDLPYLEDMGRKAREYKVEALIVGADYMSGRDALVKAIEEAGPGQLVHPYYGTLQVVVAESQLTESTRDGGMARFSLVFVEAGRQQEPQAQVDTEAVLVDQFLGTGSTITDEFSLKFSVDGQPDFVVQDALDSVGQALKVPGMALGDLNWIRADPLSAMRSLLPENQLGSLGNPLSLARGLLGLVNVAKNVLPLFDFGLPVIADTGALTPSRQAQRGNRLALTDLIQQAAATRRIVDLGQSAPATLDDARAARAEIIARADAVLLAPGIGQAVSDAMVQLRTDAIRHLGRQTADLPRTVRLVPQAVQPAIVAAHDFYGDGWLADGRDAELVSRNRVRHPGFVPAGQPLDFISG